MSPVPLCGAALSVHAVGDAGTVLQLLVRLGVLRLSVVAAVGPRRSSGGSCVGAQLPCCHEVVWHHCSGLLSRTYAIATSSLEPRSRGSVTVVVCARALAGVLRCPQAPRQSRERRLVSLDDEGGGLDSSVVSRSVDLFLSVNRRAHCTNSACLELLRLCILHAMLGPFACSELRTRSHFYAPRAGRNLRWSASARRR